MFLFFFWVPLTALLVPWRWEAQLGGWESRLKVKPISSPAHYKPNPLYLKQKEFFLPTYTSLHTCSRNWNWPFSFLLVLHNFLYGFYWSSIEFYLSYVLFYWSAFVYKTVIRFQGAMLLPLKLLFLNSWFWKKIISKTSLFIRTYWAYRISGSSSPIYWNLQENRHNYASWCPPLI